MNLAVAKGWIQTDGMVSSRCVAIYAEKIYGTVLRIRMKDWSPRFGSTSSSTALYLNTRPQLAFKRFTWGLCIQTTTSLIRSGLEEFIVPKLFDQSHSFRRERKHSRRTHHLLLFSPQPNLSNPKMCLRRFSIEISASAASIRSRGALYFDYLVSKIVGG